MFLSLKYGLLDHGVNNLTEVHVSFICSYAIGICCHDTLKTLVGLGKKKSHTFEI